MLVAQHGPKARAVVNVARGDTPLEDADLRGIEREAEALVGDLQPGFDAAALLVFREQFLVGELGGALAGAGAAREVHAEAEEDGDAEAGGEGELGEVAAVARKEDRGGSKADADTPVRDGELLLDRQGSVERAVVRREGEDAVVGDGDDDIVALDLLHLARHVAEENRVAVLGGDITHKLSDLVERRVEHEAAIERALARHVHRDRRREGRAAVGGIDRQPARALLRRGAGGTRCCAAGSIGRAVVEVDRAFVLVVRIPPRVADGEIEESEGETAGLGGILLREKLERIGIPARILPAGGGTGQGGIRLPFAHETVHLEGLPLEDAADFDREGFDDALGRAPGVAVLLAAETDKQRDGDGHAADDRRHGRPGGRVAGKLGAFPPGQEHESQAKQGERDRRKRRGGGGRTPHVNRGEVRRVAEQGRETGGGDDRADHGLGKNAAARTPPGAAPHQHEAAQDQGGGEHHRHPARMLGAIEPAIVNEQLVDAEIPAEEILREGRPPDQGRQATDGGKTVAVKINEEEGGAEDGEGHRCVDPHRRRCAERHQQLINLEPPTRQG